MFRRVCPKCQRAGLVRGERVIKGGVAITEFTCNGCGHQWQEPDERGNPPERGKKESR